jgi:hypothetical protein
MRKDIEAIYLKIKKNTFLFILLSVIGVYVLLIIHNFLFSATKDTVYFNWLYKKVNIDNFINSAQWVQAIGVIVTAGFGYLVFEQLSSTNEQLTLTKEELSLTKDQLKFQRQMVLAENYKNIAAKKYRIVRNLVFRKEMDDFYKHVEKCRLNMESDASGGDFNKYLDEIKESFKVHANKLPTDELRKVGIDMVEELLNEYNNLARIIIVGELGNDILPEQAIDNAKRFFEKIKCYIDFRRIGPNQSKYAKSYTDWISSANQINN